MIHFRLHSRFCGRQTRQWKTKFSEITIEYKQSKGRSRQTTRSRPHSIHRESNTAEASRSKAAQDRTDRLNRIKALHRLYQLKTRENREYLSSRNEGYQSDSSRRYSSRLDNYSNRRYYRHLNDLDGDNTRIEKDLLIDGNHYIYDLETNTYGVTTIYRDALSIRLLGVGDPASFDSEFVVHSGVNGTEPSLEHYLENLNENSTAETSYKTDDAESNQDLQKDLLESRYESMERFKRSYRVPSEPKGSPTPQENRRRLQQNTANSRSRSPNRQRYRVPPRYRKNSQASAASRRSLFSLNPYFRNRNEIIPNKPSKPSREGSYKLNKYGYTDPRVSTETNNRRGHSQRPRSGRRFRKREYFVLKVNLKMCQQVDSHISASI